MRILAIVAFALGLWCFGEAFHNLGRNNNLAELYAIIGGINVLNNLFAVALYSRRGLGEMGSRYVRNV